MASPGCTNRIQPTASFSLSSSSSSPRHKLVASYNLSPRAAGPATPSCVGRLPSPLGPCTRRTAALPRLEDLYHLQRVIGQGAYGVVWMAVDRRTGRRVAVKKIADVFGDTKEAKRTLREVRLMRHFRGSSPHVLAILDLLPMAPAPAPESSEEGEGEEEVSASNFRDLYVVTEFVDGGDLSQECNKSAPGWKAPDEERAKAVALGLLSGLRVIHRARVLHRDVRPKNVLTGSAGAIKIADFGMGRGKAKKVEKTQNRMKLSLMEFVSNRYYTAPEGLLPNNEYSYPVDVWAVGCVVAEMLLGYNIFKDSRFPDQMRTVINVTGTPTEEDIASIANGRNEKFRAYIRTVQAQEPDRLWNLLPNLSPDGKHFLRRLLAFNPTKRATTEEALDHPWLRSVSAAPSSDPDARPGATSEEVAPFDGRDIEAAEEEADLRRLLWKEIESYRAVDAVDWSEETRV